MKGCSPNRRASLKAYRGKTPSAPFNNLIINCMVKSFIVKIIHKSALRELAVSMLIILPAVNLVMMMEKLMRLSRVLSSVGASPRELFSIILYSQPDLLMMTLPVSFLFSVLYTWGRLNADNELLVMKSSGMSFREAALPVFVMGAVCIALGLFVSFYLQPVGKRALRGALSDTIRLRAPNAIEPGVFTTLIKDTVIYASRGSGKDLKEVFISDERKPERLIVIYAKEGRVEPADEGVSVFLNLKDGLVHMINGERMTEIFFGTYKLLLPLSVDLPGKRLGELTPAALLREARDMEDGTQRIRRFVEFHKRLSFPLFNLATVFLAPVLSLYAGKRARLGGLAMGTMFFSLYYVMLTYAERLSEAGKLHHAVGGWAPFLLVLAASFQAFRKANRR